MTYIKHTDNINGGDFTQETVNRLTVQSIAVAPKEVKKYFTDTYNNEYDPYNSVVLFDTETKYIYGYILAHTHDIPNVDVVYKSQPTIIEFLENSKGLYISCVILRNGIKETPLIHLLNSIHCVYCDGDTNKDNLYIWMDVREIIWSPTKQDCGISICRLNRVSRVFYDKCV